MEKIRLGKTGLMASRIGFGGIPIQRVPEDEAVAVVRKCLDLGVNYLDTAMAYTNSEEKIGKAIAGRREQVILSTKTQAKTAAEAERSLAQSLKRLGVETIDLYQFHNVSSMDNLEGVLAPGGPLSALEDAKKAGIIRHIGITSHQIDAAKAAVRSDRFETIMFPFNFITREATEELLPMARERDMGFIAMKPLGGGRLTNATLAFKFLFQYPDVLPIPGIEKAGEIEEIVQLAEGPKEMTASEEKEIERLREELGNYFCRRCDYCRPCTVEIPISNVMSMPMFFNMRSRKSLFSGKTAALMEKAAECISCGECEQRCPYHLPIRRMIFDYVNRYEKEREKYLREGGG